MKNKMNTTSLESPLFDIKSIESQSETHQVASGRFRNLIRKTGVLVVSLLIFIGGGAMCLKLKTLL